MYLGWLERVKQQMSAGRGRKIICSKISARDIPHSDLFPISRVWLDLLPCLVNFSAGSFNSLLKELGERQKWLDQLFLAFPLNFHSPLFPCTQTRSRIRTLWNKYLPWLFFFLTKGSLPHSLFRAFIWSHNWTKVTLRSLQKSQQNLTKMIQSHNM